MDQTGHFENSRTNYRALPFALPFKVAGGVFVLSLSFCLARPVSPIQGQQDRDKIAGEESKNYYDKWLNQDVVYILTEEEKDVFRKLTTDEERDQFIEQFWLRRDPDLTTAINEYREEHYRRLAYVAQHYGSGIPGWKTDRGRIYITFGPPDEQEYHSGGGTYIRPSHEGGGSTNTYPFEIWHYRYIPGIGDDIEIEFVDRSWSGEFKLALYPWEKDMLLHVDGLGETTSERLGLTRRYERPGLHPGHINNTNYMTKFMGQRFKDRPFERLRQFFALQRPPQIKQKELKTIVDTKVSYEMLPFSTSIYPIRVDDQTSLAPITIEVPNQKLDYVPYSNGVYKARVGIYGRISNLSGEVKGEFEDVVVSEYKNRFLETGRQMKSLYQKSFLLEPGRYKVELVVKDMESGKIGTLLQSLHISGKGGDEFGASPIIVAKELEKLETFADAPTSFVIGDVRVVPNVERKFLTRQDLGLYLQVYNPALDSSTFEPAVSVDYEILRDNQVQVKVSDPGGNSIVYADPDRLVLMKKVRLRDFRKGRYQVRITVKDAISGKALSRETDFEVVEFPNELAQNSADPAKR